MHRLEGYINADGFVTSKPNAETIPGEGNGFLNTGLVWACGMYDEVPIQTMIANCRESATVPLIWRSPHKKNPDDHQTQDDYDGALPMSQIWALEVLIYAETHDWDFSLHEEDEGDLEYRFDRFWHFAPFLYICAGRSLDIWSQVKLASYMLWNCFDIDNADPNKKAFCVMKKSYKEVVFGKMIFDLWISRVRKKYGTIGGSWAAAHPGHPVNSYDGENL
jgi:hypothetical protein